MLYSEKLPHFAAAHQCKTVTVDGANYRYILEENDNGKTLVFLNGGMVAQIYVQKYPGETGGLVLIATGGMALHASLMTVRRWSVTRKYIQNTWAAFSSRD